MKKKILIVDDEEDIRSVVKTVLGNKGYEITTAKNGEDALANLKKTKFDLVLIDFFMPKMSGIDLVKAIRKEPDMKDTKLAFLTVALFSSSGVEKLKKLDILDYICKPFDNEDLIKRVKKMVE